MFFFYWNTCLSWWTGFRAPRWLLSLLRFRKDFLNVKLFLTGTFGKIKITKIQCLWLMRSSWLFCIVPACEVSVSLFCMFTLQSQPLWFIPVNAMQPDIYSLTHRLFLPFHHFWICCCHVCCKWVEKQAGRPAFIPCHVLSSQLSSISKAINSTETPVKEKHARRILYKNKQKNHASKLESPVWSTVLVSITRFIESKMIPPISDGLQWISNQEYNAVQQLLNLSITVGKHSSFITPMAQMCFCYVSPVQTRQELS